MSKHKTKDSTKVLQQKRHRRRRWITFVRMCRYGVNNFSRNAWLTVAATAVMTITLLIVFTSVAAQFILSDTVRTISQKVEMSIYLKTGTERSDAAKAISELEQLSNVKGTQFISSSEARQKFIDTYKGDQDAIDSVGEAKNKLPATVRIQLEDINDTSQLETFVKENESIKELLHETREPSFLGPKQMAIKTIAGWSVLARQVGLVVSIIAVLIASLIIFNTIRMAIFSRKEEINMMKIIGADRGFIRGPFVVEAMVYGFIAAIIASSVGYGMLFALKDKLIDGIAIENTLNHAITFAGFIVLGMIVLGAIIGVLSSTFATRRYLKI